MRENRYFVIPVNILTPVCARPVFLGHTTHYRVSWYAASIWAPHTTQDVKKIEMLQRRAVRFICNNYYRNTSVTNLSLDSLGWPSLKSRRSYLKLNLTYKILNNLICIPYDNFKPVTYYTCGCQHHLQCTYDSYRYSFFSSAIWLWNSLPLNTATCNDVDEFDQKLKNHFWIIFLYMHYTVDWGLHITHK